MNLNLSYRKRQAQRKGPASILQDLVEDEAHDRPPHVILLDQLFSFIGSNPEKAVSGAGGLHLEMCNVSNNDNERFHPCHSEFFFENAQMY